MLVQTNRYYLCAVFRFGCTVSILLFFSILSVLAQGRQRCSTVEFELQRERNQLLPETRQQFEKWVSEKTTATLHAPEAKRTKAASYQVQVVVHIIHNGEGVGEGTNISQAQINSQLQVLNQDFKRMNNDASSTPEEFQALAGSMPVEFVFASTDPVGNPTTGIIRVKGTKTAWTLADDAALKSLSYWPAENYINIWVCNLTDSYGYAQFPVSTLEGLSSTSSDRLTDGIMIAYNAFGSIDYGDFFLVSPYNKGRTLTHEMGHFLGLRHIWGDEPGCMGTDYVDDTPPQEKLTTGCPSHPQKECPQNNPVSKMFQNYLDYTNDACMNLFTKGQVERMTIVLESSPRRASLLLPLSSEPAEAQFPKIFSPNDDGINDFWLWSNTLDYTDCTLFIYNRFGQQVYTSTSYDNTWNGRTSLGQPLEAEAYYYIIKCEGKKDVTGAVRIVR